MKKVKTKYWTDFLKSIGLTFKRKNGDHHVWDKQTGKQLDRPIIFRGDRPEIPLFHIHTNLKTLGMTHKDFDEYLKKK